MILLDKNSTSHFVVIVIFRAIGNAPILKQKIFKLTASNKFQTVIQFLRKELRYQGSDPLVKKKEKKVKAC